MASYVVPKKGVEFIFYVGLDSVATAGALQANPTLASGDFKVSIDGGALANLATLPTVTPASGKMVKITLSTSEMNGDNITVVCSDASGGEWKDLIVNIQTAARQIDDLAFPTTSGRSIDVTTTGEVGIDWANIGSPTTSVNLSGTTAGLIDGAITAAKIATNAIDADAIAADAVTELQSGLATAASIAALNNLSAAQVNAEVDTAIADAALATAANLATLTGYVDTEVAAIKAKTDNLPASPASEATLTTIAGYIDTEISAILAAVDTEIGAIKAVTDALPDAGALTTLTNNVAAILADTSTDGVVLADGAIAAAKIAANAITAAKLATDALQAIADAVLGRSRANTDNTASTDSLYELIGAILDGSTATGSLVVKKTDGVTTFNTRPLDTDPDAIPIVGIG